MDHRIGGALIVAGSAGFAVLLAVGLAGASIASADDLVTGVILLASAGCAGIGAGLLAIDGSERREGWAVRWGLGLVAASLLGLIAGELWMIVIPIQGDPLSSPLILVLGGSYLGLLAGQLLVGLALVIRSRSRRIAGGLVLLGLGVVLLGAVGLLFRVGDLAVAIRLAGLVSLLLGWAVLGSIAIRDASD